MVSMVQKGESVMPSSTEVVGDGKQSKLCLEQSYLHVPYVYMYLYITFRKPVPEGRQVKLIWGQKNCPSGHFLSTLEL